MSYPKPWKSYADQLDKLIDRGMVVTDRDRALDYLERIGYYRLSGYFYKPHEHAAEQRDQGQHGGMITPRIKSSGFFPEETPDDMFLVRHRKTKLEGYVQTLAAMDALIDFSEMAVDTVCPRADRSKGGRPPYATEVLVRMVKAHLLAFPDLSHLGLNLAGMGAPGGGEADW